MIIIAYLDDIFISDSAYIFNQARTSLYYEVSMNDIVLNYILSLLPQHFRPAVKNYLTVYPQISEIRLRINAPLSFTECYDNIITALTVTRSDLNYVINKITDNNLLLCEPLIRCGYIPLKHDVRVGVCGDAIIVDGVIRAIRSINYINIRIPHNAAIECDDIIEYISKLNYNVSLLILSAPGGGKTTLLRSIAAQLSSPEHSRRIAIIDTNREFSTLSTNSSLADIFSGYPKADGISIATRYFDPQYIICDELGGSSETKAICEALNSGVPIIASAHATSVDNARKRKNIEYLLARSIFNAVVTIEPNYNYKINEL